jgi:DNA-binding CsgD family transcriptional regulator
MDKIAIDIERSGAMHHLAALFLSSKTASDFCRGIVMHPLLGVHAIGSELLILSQQATLKTLAFFGTPLSAIGEPISLWDQSLIAEASRTNKVTKGKFRDKTTDEDVFVYCYPCSTLTQTVGMIVILKSVEYDVELKEEDQITLALVGALWFESVGVSRFEDRHGTGAEFPSDLTDRQLRILQRMSEGMTNAQIAVDLIVSQSTIRQETIKIYTNLSVSGRSEATKRAFHLGLIDRPIK